MPKILVVDASTIIALERASLLEYLNKIDYKIKIPQSVSKEVGKIEGLSVVVLKGKTLNNARTLEKFNIGKGEAECIALAKKLNLNFIICDDKKLMRQLFFSENRSLKDMKLLGFSFFLHEFYKKELIKDVWKHFNLIIKTSNWERSEVQVSNYTFLKGLGY